MKSGADEVIVEDLRKEFAEQYCFPMLRAHAIYEQDYLLGTSVARPADRQGAGERGPQDRADAVSHGATGKGTTRSVSSSPYNGALAPDLQIVAPVEGPPRSS